MVVSRHRQQGEVLSLLMYSMWRTVKWFVMQVDADGSVQRQYQRQRTQAHEPEPGTPASHLQPAEWSENTHSCTEIHKNALYA